MVQDLTALTQDRPGLQRSLEQMARTSEIDISPTVDGEFEILYPNRPESDITEARRRHSERARALGYQWSEFEPVEVASKLARIEREAAEANLRFPNETLTVAHAMAERVADPYEWTRSLMDADLNPNTVQPFLDRAARESELAVDLVEKCLESSRYRLIGVSVAIAVVSIPRKVLLKARELAGGCEELIEGYCQHGDVPEPNLIALLDGGVASIRLAAGIAEWLSEERGTVRPSVRSEWRAAILSVCQDGDSLSHGAYWLSEILKADSQLAFDFLKAVINAGAYLSFHLDEVATNAASALDTEHRIALLQEGIPPLAAKLIKTLVGNDPDAYNALLSNRTLEPHHLDPLEGEEEGELPIGWPQLVGQALGFGHLGRDIVDATLAGSRGWTGPMSGMLSKTLAGFAQYVDHEDPDVARVAKLGVGTLSERIEEQRERERLERVFGE